MSHTARSGPSQLAVELGVAGLMALVAVLGMYGSLRVGVGWGADGPRAGFFPFYVSLIVLVACAVNAVRTVTTVDRQEREKVFADWPQLRQVASVLVPTVVYVALVPALGIYVASSLLIAAFMRWFGGYRWMPTVAVAVVVPILIFITFETWFLVPLPKGPLESLLGY